MHVQWILYATSGISVEFRVLTTCTQNFKDDSVGDVDTFTHDPLVQHPYYIAGIGCIAVYRCFRQTAAEAAEHTGRLHSHDRNLEFGQLLD